MVEKARDSFDRVLRTGVPVALGTDAGTPHNPHGGAPHELAHMIDWGMPPLEAMRAATSEAARLLRLDDRIGSIAPGMRADLAVYAGQPLGTDGWLALAWCVGLLVAAYALAMAAYRRKLA